MIFAHVAYLRTLDIESANLSVSSGVAFSVLLLMSAHMLPIVSSPVFVPLFVPVISDVNAIVQFASCRVYVLLSVLVLVKNDVNVFATLRRPNTPLRNVFTQVVNVCAAVMPTNCSDIFAGSYTLESIFPGSHCGPGGPFMLPCSTNTHETFL